MLHGFVYHRRMDPGTGRGGERAGEREGRTGGESGPAAAGWGAARVRALREHLRESQSGLAERIGTRQQTISEWETGAARPRRMSRRLLHIVAEEGGFYSTERAEGAGGGEHAAHDGGDVDGAGRGASP